MTWYRTPGGIMRQLEPTRTDEPGHWYIDRDQRFHAYADACCRPTKAPAWARREQVGRELLTMRKALR